MIKNALKYMVLFTAVIIVAVCIDWNIHGIPKFGPFIGGLLLGIFIKKHRILYGALCGFIYAAVILAILIMIPLGMKLSFGEVFNLFLKDIIMAKEIFNILSIPLLFVLGSWIGGAVRIRIQE